MKIVFRKQTLIEKLYPTLGTVSVKDTLACAGGVLMETMGGRTVRLSTYDMNKGMRVTLEAEDVPEEGSCIIPATRLLQILKLLDEETVTISVDDHMMAHIEAGKASFALSAMEGSAFPTLPELSGSRAFEIKSEILRDMIGRVLHSVAEKDSRPMLCGAFFKIGAGKIEVISCDSYALSRCSAICDLRDVGETSVLDFSFLIPGHALNELVKILGDGDEVTAVTIARKHAIFSLRDMVFFTRMIDSEYIDYERIIPHNQSIFVTVSREGLIAALERAGLIAEEKIQGSGRNYVKLVLEGDSMVVTSTSVNGRVYDELPVTHTGDDLQIGFNCRYLINCVRASEGDMIDIALKSPTQSLIITPHEKREDRDFLYMVLPVRMNG